MAGQEYLDFIASDERNILDPYDRTGKRPMPLRTSWNMHERTPTADRVPVVQWFVDDSEGVTVGRCSSESQAYAMVSDLMKSGSRCIVRPFVLCEETLSADRRTRKDRAQYGY